MALHWKFFEFLMYMLNGVFYKGLMMNYYVFSLMLCLSFFSSHSNSYTLHAQDEVIEGVLEVGLRVTVWMTFAIPLMQIKVWNIAF